MARNEPQVNLRIPEALKSELDAAAIKNKRSLTAEIVARLEASFDVDGDLVAKFDQLMDVRQARLLEELKETVRTMLVRGDGTPED